MLSNAPLSGGAGRTHETACMHACVYKCMIQVNAKHNALFYLKLKLKEMER